VALGAAQLLNVTDDVDVTEEFKSADDEGQKADV
jgi:hypothetical protein